MVAGGSWSWFSDRVSMMVVQSGGKWWRFILANDFAMVSNGRSWSVIVHSSIQHDLDLTVGLLWGLASFQRLCSVLSPVWWFAPLQPILLYQKKSTPPYDPNVIILPCFLCKNISSSIPLAKCWLVDSSLSFSSTSQTQGPQLVEHQRSCWSA